MRNALVFAVALALPSYGCGTVLQVIVGWDHQEQVKKTETRTVSVTSAPPGATIIRRGGDAGDVTLGQSPLTDSHALQVEETVETPSTWAIWTGCVVEGVAGVAMAAVAGGDSSSSSSGSDPFSEDFSAGGGGGDKFQITGGFLILGALVDLVVGIVQESGTPNVTKHEVVAGRGEYQYIARADGLPEVSQRVTVPDMSAAHLVLDPKYVAQQPTQQPTQQPSTPPVTPKLPDQKASPSLIATGVVIAVMNVEDANAGERDRALDPSLVKNLGDQIRVFIAQQGVRTIDRSSQDRALKDQIASVKSDSYKSCYDDSCQIELGKALAASHILRTRVARFGKRCVLNGELIDLKQEVTMAAASSQGDCGEEGFLNMGEEIAKNLVRVH